MELKIGDVVRLKSDIQENVLMTINDYSSEGKSFWNCVWFSGSDLKFGSFHNNALLKLN